MTTTTKTEHGRRVIDGITHGTNASYQLGCRCRPCTSAHNTYEKGRNALRRAKRAEMKERAAQGIVTPVTRRSTITMVVVVCKNCGRRGRANSKLVEALGTKIEKCDECRKHA